MRLPADVNSALQGCNYACAITTVDGASIFAAGSDRKLKHLQVSSPAIMLFFAAFMQLAMIVFATPVDGVASSRACAFAWAAVFMRTSLR